MTLEDYIQFYQLDISNVRNISLLHKLAIMILDIDTIMNKKYEDEIIPWIFNHFGEIKPLNTWIGEYMEKASMENLPLFQLKSRGYDYQMNFKTFKDAPSDIQLRVELAKMDHRYHELHKISQEIATIGDAFHQDDIHNALEKIYIAALYKEHKKVSSEYKELQKNLAWMKRFLRECFTK